MYSISDIRKNLKIQIDGVPYVVEDFQHVKPARGGAFVRTRLRNLITGNILEKTFKGGAKLEPADLEERKMQFLYREADRYYFMDMETYEQIFLTEEQVGDANKFMPENIEVDILFFNNKPIGIKLPNFVELEVVKAEPAVRGDTATTATKSVTLSTGAKIQVPLFVEEGDIIRVDTRTGEYVTRV
ncbi:MAG: elongation factor P [Nitrospirae bacterium]|nr:MAG: elongation factor P [Nitrospirota bacterium]